MIAVFSCDGSSTHTCWKVCFRSTLVNTVHPASCSSKVVSAGSGYLSSLVIAFTRRKSPQTRQEPSGFLTAWIGEAQFDSHRWMTQLFSNLCIFLTMEFSTWRIDRRSFCNNVKRNGHGDDIAQTGVSNLWELCQQKLKVIYFASVAQFAMTEICHRSCRNQRKKPRMSYCPPETFPSCSDLWDSVFVDQWCSVFLLHLERSPCRELDGPRQPQPCHGNKACRGRSILHFGDRRYEGVVRLQWISCVRCDWESVSRLK